MRRILILGAGTLVLAACQGTLAGKEGDPPAAPPAGEGGVFQAGPVTSIDQGPGTRSLYREFQEAQRRLRQQEEELGRLRGRLKEAEEGLARLTRERDAEKAGRAGAEAERDQARTELRDREVQVLTLALEKTRAEQLLVEEQLKALAVKPEKGAKEE